MYVLKMKIIAYDTPWGEKGNFWTIICQNWIVFEIWWNIKTGLSQKVQTKHNTLLCFGTAGGKNIDLIDLLIVGKNIDFINLFGKNIDFIDLFVELPIYTFKCLLLKNNDIPQPNFLKWMNNYYLFISIL